MIGRVLLFTAVFLGTVGAGVLFLVARDRATDGHPQDTPGMRTVTLSVSGMW
jgi:hypothetical protein